MACGAHEAGASAATARIMQVIYCDGTTLSLELDDHATVGSLRRRLAVAPAARPSLCCAGASLSDSQRLRDLPSMRVHAWLPRFTRHRSDDEHALALARRRAAEERASVPGRCRTAAISGWRLLAVASPIVLRTLRRTQARTYAYAVAYLAVAYFARRTGLESLFFFGTALLCIYHGLGERKPGEASAYTVFNEGFRALPGQLRGEDLERDLMRGF